MALEVRYQESLRPFPVRLAPTATLSEVLEAACKHFNVDPAKHDLCNKGQFLDLALTLRMARLPHGTKLDLVPAPAARLQQPVSIALDYKGQDRRTLKLSCTLTVWEVLVAFEQDESSGKAKLNLTKLYGVPEQPEKGPGYEIVINVPGYLQPVVSILGRTIDSVDEMKSKTLAALGLRGGSVLIRVTHKVRWMIDLIWATDRSRVIGWVGRLCQFGLVNIIDRSPDCHLACFQTPLRLKNTFTDGLC